MVTLAPKTSHFSYTFPAIQGVQAGGNSTFRCVRLGCWRSFCLWQWADNARAMPGSPRKLEDQLRGLKDWGREKFGWSRVKDSSIQWSITCLRSFLTLIIDQIIDNALLRNDMSTELTVEERRRSLFGDSASPAQTIN